jgi:hypothetical protein
MFTDAYFSDDRVYRYWLIRIWDFSLPINCVCGVNPSVANETANDPTIRKDIGFSSRQGFGGLLKLNVSAFCSTNPRGVNKQPIGEMNTALDLKMYFDTFEAKQFIAAWGRNGRFFSYYTKAILLEFPEAKCFGKNPDGTPRHTLMLPYSSKLELVNVAIS